ncbi:TPA: hypothetical protein EYP12_07850 [Candidatus Bipolaricaulota bacterium]|nr:hypothetical protein [Candidatus Bipolaricaulota bacterium]
MNLYQYYATVHFRTCERCLTRHGEIFEDPSQAPPLHPGCRCSYLEFPTKERDYYREKAQRMQAKAKAELHRRELWRQAKELLVTAPERALELFRQAAEIEVYPEEVEELCRDRVRTPTWSQNPELVRKLREILLYGYQDKFTREKYAHLPEGMRWALESFGVQRIKEVFHELLPL